MPNCHVLTVMEDEFTAEQRKEAIKLMSAAKRNGTVSELPEWVILAKREYGRVWSREHQRVKPTPSNVEARHPHQALRNDGIIDWTAVEIAVNGMRVVNLTRFERLLAAAYMYEVLNLQFRDIGIHLGLSQVTHLMNNVKAGKHKEVLRRIDAGELKTSGKPLKF